MDRFNPDVDANHKSKCRICFKQCVNFVQQIRITQLIEKQFFEVTQRELVICEDLSNFICYLCKNQLLEFCHFKENAIEFQEKLFGFTNFISFIDQMKVKDEPKWDEVITEVKTELELDFNDRFGSDDDEESGKIEDTEPSSSKLVKITKPSKSNLVDRILSGMRTPFTQCQDCGKTVRKSKMTTHIRQHHQKLKSFVCDLCGTRTLTKFSLAKHITSHIWEPKEKFKCDQCDFVTSGPIILHHHKRAVHFKEILTKGIHKCTKCGLTFPTTQERIAHNVKTHYVRKRVSKILRCEYCTKEFTQGHSLRFHQFRSHPAETEEARRREENKEIQLTCAECNFMTTDKKQMKTHLNEHLGELNDKPICICEKCGVVFLDEGKLYLHKKDHYRNKLCDLCGKSFRSKNELALHKKSKHNNGKREVECHICGNLYATEVDLRYHLMGHNERKFVCTQPGCEKSFIRNSLLNNHLKTHTGVRDIICEICSAAFILKHQLKTHIQTVHGSLKLTCEICSNIYKTSSGLRMHCKRHHKHLSKDEIIKLVTRAKQNN